MSPLVYLIWVAGGLHLLVASANFFAPRVFHYGENLRKVSPVVRQVFIVQNGYIVFFLTNLALVCFLFAPELAGGSALGRYLSGFLAIFWGVRVLLQFFYYDREERRKRRLFDVSFVVADSYLCLVFAAAALGPVG